MPLNRLSIDGVPYTIVDSSRLQTGRRSYAETMRPSQPSEARLNTKTWKLSGPIGNSRQISFGDPLGPDYTINLDGRNEGLLTSAAAATSVALTAIGSSVQYGVPISDVTKTNWSQGAGDGDGSAFDELDEGIVGGVPDDATTYWTTSSGTDSGSNLTCGITALTDPTVDTGFAARWRVRSNTTAEFIHFILFQGTTAILNQYQQVAATETWETIAFELSEATAANITDFTTLRMALHRITGSTGRLDISAMELTLPAVDEGDVITIDEDRGQLFAQRGRYSTQINPGDMREAENVDHLAQVTDSVASWLGNGFVALEGTDVKKRSAVTSESSTYASASGVDAVHMAVGPDRVWISDASDGQVKYAVADLSSVNLSNGIQVADTNSGHITGLYTLGELMVAGTQRGPRSFTDAGAPAVLGEAVKDFPSTINGASGDSLWGWHYSGTKLGLFAISPDGRVENPVGPGEGEEGMRFEGPIDGYPIAVKSFKDSLWVSYLTPDGDSWLLRGMFNARMTPGSGRPEWYVFRKLTGLECHAIGATTGRTVPALVWGENENIAYSDLAFRGREIADTTNYVYSTDNGQWFGTTLTLPIGLVGNVRWAKFFTENGVDSTDTWQLATSPDEGAYVDIGSATGSTNGLQTVRPVTGSPAVPLTTQTFTTLKPRLTQVASSSTAPPQIRGDLTIAYDERPEHVREIDVVIEGNGADLAVLQALVGADTTTPTEMRLPTQTELNAKLYCYLMAATPQDGRDPDDQLISLKLLQWVTS